MLKIPLKLLSKLHRSILNIALYIIKHHVKHQDGLALLTYDRRSDNLTHITWKARGVTLQTNNAEKGAAKTNNWPNLEELVDYRNKIVLDVGASLGVTAAQFARKASEVHAFEPHPDNFEFLNDQVNIRQINNIYTYKVAISNFTGEANFFGRESHGVHSLGIHNKGRVISQHKVPVQTLDTFCASKLDDRIGLLKIDVEGFEADVLQGATGLLRDKKIDFILFEFSPSIHRLRKIPSDAPIKILSDHDYEVYDLSGKKFTSTDYKKIKVCDLYAIPR